MTPKLREAAKTINALAKQEHDSRLALCRAIASAMELVKKESNLTFYEWADKYLRKPDGSKWSLSHIYKMAMFGRNPKKLQRYREDIAQRGRTARRALVDVRLAAQQAPKERATTLDRQVEMLMFAWRNASPEARKVFLEKIAGDQKAAA